VNQSLNICVKVPKKEPYQWEVKKQATCELLVSSRVVRNRENPHQHGVIFAVVPAHLIVSPQQFKRAKETDDTWRWNNNNNNNNNNNSNNIEPEEETHPELVSRIQCDHHGSSDEQNEDEGKKVEPEARISIIRKEIMANSINTEYVLKVSEEANKIVSIEVQGELRTNVSADAKWPLLLGCRQRYVQSQSEDIKCPAGLCPQLQNDTCHHMFLNDMALLPIEYDDAVRLQRLLTTVQDSAGKNIYKIKSLAHLAQLYRNAIDHGVVIQNKYKSLKGMLKVVLRPSGRERVKDGKHLSFIITSETNGVKE